MKKQLTTAVIASLFVSTYAFALSADQALSDTRGDVIKDTWGDCVLTHDGLDTCKPAKAEPVTEEMRLGADTFFAFDKAVLKPEGKQELDRLVQKLNAAPEVRSINLSGHTDSIGSADYNQRLSERRAQAVKDYLVSAGVSPTIIEAQGFGKMQPVASNSTPEGRAQNRRVDIKIDLIK